MGPEATLWNWMKAGLKKVEPPHDVHRIETSTESGYPDVEGCIGGTSFLLELKVARSLRKTTTNFSLDHYHSKQAYTLYHRWKAGGRSWILVRYPGQDNLHFVVAGREALILHDNRLKLNIPMIQAMSWPGFEDGLALAPKLWRGFIGPIV